MSRQQMARTQGAEEAKRIILQSDTLSSQEKDVLINNLDQSLNRFNLCLGKDKIAGSSEENPDTHQDNLVKIKVENKPSDKRAGALLQAAAKKLGMDVAGTVMFETSENLNMGVMCSGNNKEGYAPIITARDSNSKAHKAALLGDSLDGGGISQFGNADTPIYGQETPGLIPLETMLVDPQVIKQVFVPGVVEKIIGHKKVYPNIAIKVVYYNNVQFTWSFRDYDSLSRDGVSDFNRSILKAFNWRFMGNVIFDEFNEEEWGLAKLQALSLRQKARMMGWKQQLNSIRRFGYMDGQGRYKIRGIDNAIGTLPRMQATPNNGSSPYAEPAGRSYTQFQQDFASIWTELQRRTTLVKLGKNRDEIVIRENKIHTNYSQIIFESIESKVANFTIEKMERTTNFVIDQNKNIALLNADKVVFPLILRAWQHGDTFQPLGMKNKKLVSDFLINNKVSLFDKENVKVLTSNNQIIWVVGMRIDNRFAITDSTKAILKIEYSKTV